MKTELYLFYVAVCIAIGLNASAENKSDKELMIANYLYAHWSFYEAIEHYEKVSDYNSSVDVMAKLGDCYKFINEIDKAASCYAIAIQLGNCPAYVKLNYAEIFMEQEKYAEAKKLLVEYQTTMPESRSVYNKIKSCEYADSLNKTAPTGIVCLEKFNTDNHEFAPTLYANDLIFTTDSIYNHLEGHKKDKWTGEPYYNISFVGLNEMGRADTEVKNAASNVNTKFHDGVCSFSQDGHIMVFTRTNNVNHVTYSPIVKMSKNNIYNLQIMVATDYDAVTGKYKKIIPFAHNKSYYSCIHPSLSNDGKTLVFASDMPGGEGGIDLYLSTIDSRGKWTPPVNLGPQINTEADELFPSLSEDSVLYFSSNGLIGLGGLDIYKSSWNKTDQVFSSPTHMGIPVNSSYDDMSFAKHKESIVYFASNRPASKRNDNIYSYKPQAIFLSLNIVDEQTKKPLKDVEVDLISNKGKKLFAADDNGKLLTQLGLQTSYTVRVSRLGYTSMEFPLSTLEIIGNDTIEKNISLLSSLKMIYRAVVLNEKDKTPIENPIVIWIEKKGNDMKKDTIQLTTGQVFSSEIKPNGMYHIYGLKANYYSKEHYVSTKNTEHGSGAYSIADTLYMKKLEVGEVYEIEDIYYDYNKTTVREDAKPALSQLIDLLKEYPEMKIRINSHTDCRGSDAYNLKLSKNRANAVVDYLVKKGIVMDRLQSKGFGETKTVADCDCLKCTEDQHQKNRRTEFQIIAL